MFLIKLLTLEFLFIVSFYLSRNITSNLLVSCNREPWIKPEYPRKPPTKYSQRYLTFRTSVARFKPDTFSSGHIQVAVHCNALDPFAIGTHCIFYMGHNTDGKSSYVMNYITTLVTACVGSDSISIVMSRKSFLENAIACKVTDRPLSWLFYTSLLSLITYALLMHHITDKFM